MTEPKPTQESLRARIEEIDARLLELLGDRARCAAEIGEIKRAGDAPIYVPERERELMARLMARNAGPLSERAIESIWGEIVSATRALQREIDVAFLGPADTFSHMAALRVFGASARYHPLPTFADVFAEVERERIAYGVLPVESSMGGAVHDVLDLFLTSELKIVNEVLLRVEHCLLAHCEIEEVGVVYSRDNALVQCRNWLRANLPHAERVAMPSTADAADRAAREPRAAAIASRIAAHGRNLPIRAESIEDEKQNYTRFLVVGRQMVRPTGADKTSLIVTLKDKPGALHELLTPIREAELTLTRIESRPSRRQAWEYVFFIDLLGHVEDEKVAAALDRVRELAFSVKVLGAFPRGEGA